MHTKRRVNYHFYALHGWTLAYLHWSHDGLNVLRIEFQDTIQNANLVVTERLFTRAVEL